MGNDFKDLFGDWRPEDEGFSASEGSREHPETPARSALNEKEVKVVNVYEVDTGKPQHNTFFVLMRDNHGRQFRIFVMRDVAVAISMAIEGDRPDRPFTHDLMRTMLDRLGAAVERVTIDDLLQETFYAKITLTRGEESMDIDARPSDAIAMALRYRAPIYVAESVLESAQSD